MNDARYPWIIAVPRRNKIKEIYELTSRDQLLLLREINLMAEIIKSKFKSDKINIGAMGNIVPQKESEILISTKGVIGSNGNMLLFGLGNIQAANRTLDNLRNEIRNIIIRKGQAPNFQLEISNFQSQKAFLTNDSHTSKIIYLNNIPVSLKQIALAANISKSHKNLTLIKLTRDAKEFRLTAEQLFNLEAPEIIIKANDQIELSTLLNLTSSNTKSGGG